MKRKLFVGIGIIVIAGIILISLLRKGNRIEKYETTQVDRGDITEKITATGTINPVVTVKVGSQVSGRIAKIFADFNAQVKQGQVIAQLETDIYQTKVEQADANYKMAQAQVLEAKAAFLDAESNLRRARRLKQELVMSDRDLEIAETKHESTKSAYDAARARKEQSQALLNSAKVDLEHTTIHSPVDGIVISRNCDVGQTVVATFQTPDMFLIAQDLTKMQVEAYVDEADIGNIRTGQDVQFTVDAYPDRVFTGKVSQVRFAPKEQQNVISYATVAEVPNPDLTLRPGMTASVSIIAEKKMNVLRVANSALRFKADPEDKDLVKKGTSEEKDPSPEEASVTAQHRLWVLEENGQVKTFPVKVGISDSRFTELIEGPVKEKDKTIVGYQPQWRQSVSKKSFFQFGSKQ